MPSRAALKMHDEIQEKKDEETNKKRRYHDFKMYNSKMLKLLEK